MTYQTITKNPWPHIIAELLLVSRTDCTMSILLCPLVIDLILMVRSLLDCASTALIKQRNA
jgi:hypothetical protein